MSIKLVSIMNRRRHKYIVAIDQSKNSICLLSNMGDMNLGQGLQHEPTVLEYVPNFQQVVILPMDCMHCEERISLDDHPLFLTSHHP